METDTLDPMVFWIKTKNQTFIDFLNIDLPCKLNITPFLAALSALEVILTERNGLSQKWDMHPP